MSFLLQPGSKYTIILDEARDKFSDSVTLVLMRRNDGRECAVWADFGSTVNAQSTIDIVKLVLNEYKKQWTDIMAISADGASYM